MAKMVDGGENGGEINVGQLTPYLQNSLERPEIILAAQHDLTLGPGFENRPRTYNLGEGRGAHPDVT